MLTQSLLEAPGNAAAALNMIHQTRDQPQGQEDAADGYRVNLLAVRALVELDRMDDAASELLQLTSSNAPMAFLLSALQYLLNGDLQPAAIKVPIEQALHHILNRHHEDAAITSRVMGLLLDKVRMKLEDTAFGSREGKFCFQAFL